MRIVILGSSTSLGSQLVAAFAARGDKPVCLVRKSEHIDPLRALGGEPVLVDAGRDARALVTDLARVFTGANALVLAAGTGGDGRSPDVGTGTGRRSPARLFAAAGERAGVRRYLMVSNWYGSHGQSWSQTEEAAYLDAKIAAENDLRERDLDWTVVRTGRLTDAPAGGRIRLAAAAEDAAPEGEIGRADVAAAVVALIGRRDAFGRTLELTAGDEPPATALARALGGADD